MRHYQQMLLEALEAHGWRFEEKRAPNHWWSAEIWVICSTREHWGRQLFCTFLVDPQAERRSDLAAIRTISITPEPLDDWRRAGLALATLRPAERDFPDQLKLAIFQIERIRQGDSID